MRDVSMMNGSDAGAGAREIALAQEKPFQLAGTLVRPAALEVEFQGETVSLEPRVMKVLVALGRLQGEPASREMLIESCWGGRVVTDGALNRSIAQLRKGLKDPGIEITTIPRVGYRLQAPRGAALAAPPAQASLPTAAEAGAVTDAPGRPASTAAAPSSDRRGARVAAVAVVVLALAVIAWVVVMPSRAVIWTASGFRPLTSTAEQETYPALSPEGTQIVYASRANAYGARDLFLRNVNEGTPVQLTSDPSDEYGAAWSPDGSRIVFVRSVDDQPCALVVMPIPSGPERVVARCETDGETHPSWLDAQTLLFFERPVSRPVSIVRAVDIETGVVRDLTSPSDMTMGDTDPQAAPDGNQIAFRRTLVTGADDLLVLDMHSGREHAVTKDGWKASGYVWSADSQYIFFSSNREGEFGLWSVDARGRTAPRQVSQGLGAISFAHISSDRQNRVAVEITRSHNKLARFSRSGSLQWLMAGSGSDYEPAVAADGAIAHISNRGGSYEMWMYTGNSAPVRLTSIGSSYILDPAWSADGQDIAFVGIKGRSAEIYTVGRDGSRLRKLTSDSVGKKSPVFTRSGKQLMYLERRAGTWRLMELDLAGGAPRAVPDGEGWVGLRAAPDGAVFGRRGGEATIRLISPAAQIGWALPPSSAALRIALTDIDTWSVGRDGVYVRRGRRIAQPSSIWLFPWQGVEQKIADVPLASGRIAFAPNGDVLVSQTTSADMDLAMLELKPVS